MSFTVSESLFPLYSCSNIKQLLNVNMLADVHYTIYNKWANTVRQRTEREARGHLYNEGRDGRGRNRLEKGMG